MPDTNGTRDAAGDGPADVGVDSPGDSGADTGIDARVAVCPDGVAPLEVCGCGCCGGVTEGIVCYYPSRGETREGIPNPMPSPAECATNGCVDGARYVCCADPGPGAPQPTICAIDTSIEDRARFTVTRRDGDLCTTLEIGGAASFLPITLPPGWTNAGGWRALCDGPNTPVRAIGGIGTVTARASATLPHYDVHVALFFDNGTGSAEPVRIDRDDVAVAPRCTTATCPACGDVCQLDAIYSFTTSGGLTLRRDTTILSPPAGFSYLRMAELGTAVVQICAADLPACGSAAIDAADVMAAFTDPDVQRAFAPTASGMPPFYGEDQRPADGTAFEFQRMGDGTFFVGAACPAAPAQPCTPIPPGVTRLLSLMTALNQQQLADPSCAAARP